MVSDAAVTKATGEDMATWAARLDALGGDDHTERVRRLQAKHPDISGWWAQTVVVEYEKARGLREEGQTCAGDYQVSCSRTIDVPVDEAWERLVTTPFLGHTDWQEGTQTDVEGARIEVRRVDPGKMLRWFWHDGDGKSTVEVALQDKGDRCAVVFRHHGLASKDAVEAYRVRWKEALAQL